MKVVIKDNARQVLRDTALWYKLHLGRQAKDKFTRGIMAAIRSLADNPRMGHPIDKKFLGAEVEERVLVEHKNHIIYYYIERNILYVADIWSTRMEH